MQRKPNDGERKRRELERRSRRKHLRNLKQTSESNGRVSMINLSRHM